MHAARISRENSFLFFEDTSRTAVIWIGPNRIADGRFSVGDTTARICKTNQRTEGTSELGRFLCHNRKVNEQMLHKQSKDKLQIECTTHMVHDVIKPICSQFASFLVNYSAMCSLQTFFAASKRLHGQGNKDDSILQPPKTWATALKTSRTGDCDLFAVYLPCHTLKEFTCSRNRVLRPNGEES